MPILGIHSVYTHKMTLLNSTTTRTAKLCLFLYRQPPHFEVLPGHFAQLVFSSYKQSLESREVSQLPTRPSSHTMAVQTVEFTPFSDQKPGT